MLFSDTYHTLSGEATGEFKDKGSKFIGFAYPITDEQQVKDILADLKKEHYTAAHHCYAYILGPSQEIQKSNDDREPANTAGKPILRSMLSKGLTNVLVVVVRYFGGKLLGVPGLIQAYGEASAAALSAAPVTEKIITERYEVQGDYAHENEVYKAYKTFGAKIINHTYNHNQFNSIFEIRKSRADELLANLKDKRLFDIQFLSQQ